VLDSADWRRNEAIVPDWQRHRHLLRWTTEPGVS